MRHSSGLKLCLKCGALFLTDLRGGAKWCFPCKEVMRREYHKHYQRDRKSRERPGGKAVTAVAVG